jgi:hypothetical protein
MAPVVLVQSAIPSSHALYVSAVAMASLVKISLRGVIT